MSLAGPDFAVNANHGRQTGANLFHSFASFTLDSGESAIFSGPDTVKNIISRVTGGGASFINGTLESRIRDADMYFINPSGIWFGSDARLEVQGSFYASTADYLLLGETGRFDAASPERSTLTVDAPAAFGFLSESPAGISRQGSFLAVPEGKTLSFIGGDIYMEDSGARSIPPLHAPDGHIDLGAVVLRRR
ncbi:MAG: filamentous hemagglutinin N-terminal domain-containing protein [Gammaproteobacteria bacterium]|nr:filamentous hemagglutinin N-terminal domain-containing protein [Gammaproteobacteria bacterium]